MGRPASPFASLLKDHCVQNEVTEMAPTREAPKPGRGVYRDAAAVTTRARGAIFWDRTVSPQLMLSVCLEKWSGLATL